MVDKKTGDLMQIPCFTYESSEGGVGRGGNSHIRNWHKWLEFDRLDSTAKNTSIRSWLEYQECSAHHTFRSDSDFVHCPYIERPHSRRGS